MPTQHSHATIILVAVTLASAGPLAMSLYTPAMPAIAAHLGTDMAPVQLSLASFFVGYAVGQLFCGPLSDRYGRRLSAIVFMTLYLMASLIALVAQEVMLLVFARLLQGLGASAGVVLSRATVRDTANGAAAVTMLNTISMILVLGPVVAPTFGGLVVAAFDWRAVFILMAAIGVIAVAVSVWLMEETAPSGGPVKLGIFGSYAHILRSPRFIAAALANAGSTGAVYALAAILPFILIDRVGLTPTEFGFAMIAQSCGFLAGTIVLKVALRRSPMSRVLPIGAVCVAAGAGISLAAIILFGANLLTVMAPVALYTFGSSFLAVAMPAAALEPFPERAGAASAVLGFLQMSVGVIGGVFASLFADPVLALELVLPLLGATSVLSFVWWRHLQPGSA